MPPRRWDPDQAFLDRLVATAGAPWTASVPLRTLAPDRRRRRSTGSRCDYPGAQRRRELPALYLRALDAMHTSISLLAAILTDPTQLVPELRPAR